MAVSFASVTDVKIPQGNVVKIHEASSGRVIWQKNSIVFDGEYPKIIILLTKANGTKYASSGYRYTTSLKSYTSIDDGTIVSLPNCSSMEVSPYYFLNYENGKFVLDRTDSSSLGMIEIGDEFSAYYINNSSELVNFPSKAHLITDAVWHLGCNEQGFGNSNKNPIEKGLAFEAELDDKSMFKICRENAYPLVSFDIPVTETFPLKREKISVTSNTTSSIFTGNYYPYLLSKIPSGRKITNCAVLQSLFLSSDLLKSAFNKYSFDLLYSVSIYLYLHIVINYV